MASQYRGLTSEQIDQLLSQNCQCDDWSNVQVAGAFDAARIKSTFFSGAVRLGATEGEVTFDGGVRMAAGISNAKIHNCTIGDNVYINHIGNYVANYVIEDNVVIENVDLLCVDGQSSFGNGTEAVVINEAGGREVAIYDRLSAHTAYILALYRHRGQVIANLQKMIADYTASVTSSMGLIGENSRLINCRTIKNVKFGPCTTIDGADRLENGSVNSCSQDPVYIGSNVIAEDFIICSGSNITDGTLIFKCFIGQGCILGKQYSAENSIFFANCAGFHGEACSVFAGPYTVTHHKSSMLIAGLYSFLNAGSGTNQSNHLYKLGPVHQGIVERGSKTASDSYILWPARVGAFTVVMGRHYKNSDTSDLPFSYLIEHEDESILVPGVNLRSAGTIRDARKWPRRDRRKDPAKLDLINFKLLSPYTVQKMLRGRQLLESLAAEPSQEHDYHTYHNVRIKNSSISKGIDFYKMGISKFLGNCLLKRLEGAELASAEQLRSILSLSTETGSGEWLDLAGLFAPREVIENLLGEIQSGKFSSLEDLAKAFETIYNDYPEYEWAWAGTILQQQLGKSIDEITADEIIKLTEDWKSAVLKLDEMLYDDAGKEFSGSVQTGFGVDGDEDVKIADFEAVRGRFEDNSFVMEIEKHMNAKSELGDELIGRLKKLC